ncbi:MAG: cbb3-type cytochrome c oxidase subunit I [Acidimicrobiales bacterium]
MTMTETRPSAAAPEPTEIDHADAPAATPGLLGVFGTGDPTVLGRLWIGTALLFLLGGLVLATVVGIETLKPATLEIFSQRSYLQAFSLVHVGLVFLGAIPLLIGVATVVVPRQLGIATVAFPRAAAAAYWGFLLGGAMVVASYLINGGPGGRSREGVDLFIVALGLVCVALIIASVCLATTVLALRPAGLALHRVPAFAFSILVAATLWIAGIAVLVGLLALLYVDHRYQALNVLNGSASLAEYLSFATSQPQVFAVGIPVLGFAADVVPTLTGQPQKRHGTVLGAIGAFGVLSFGAWTLAAVGHPHLYREALYTLMAAAAIVPILAIVGGIGESLSKGKPVVRPPLLFALAALVMLATGAAVGALRVVARFHLVATTADDSVVFYVIGAALLAGIGAVHWWWPQIVGQHLKQPLAAASAGLALLGTVLWALPLAVTGFLDEPLGSIVPARGVVKDLNAISMVGAGVLALAVLVFLANVAGSLGRSRDDTDVPTDPWDGFTLEWAADPDAITIASPTPLLDHKLDHKAAADA